MADTRRQPFLGRTRHVHMVGIGGIGMSSIAEVLLMRGYAVSGSDLRTSETTRRLAELGAVVFEGHSEENVAEADVVVFSSAVNPVTNPETCEADRRGVPIIKRADMLGELMRMKYGVAVAGTHGKTTTTTMTGLVVAEGGFDPTVIVGGKVAVFGSNAVVGEGDIIVIEADEYDRTFLRLTPSIAVVTSIDSEHLDIYRDLDDIKDAFVRFASSVPFFGSVILCLDDENVRSIAGRVDRRIVTYGLSRQAMVRAENIESIGLTTSFDLVIEGAKAAAVSLASPGVHNVRNALAAVAVGIELEISLDQIVAGLDRFKGVQRRFEVLATVDGITVIDDYAHHPAEVEATLKAAVRVWPDRRIIAVFQPHLYSRTDQLKREFAAAFLEADTVVITDIYGAREEPIEGVDGSLIVALAKELGHGDVRYVPAVKDVPRVLSEIVSLGEVVVFMGAGDIWRHSREFVKLLRELRGEEVN